MRKILIFLNPLYALFVFIKNALYDANIIKSKSYDVPVLVVGNLTAGGSGKTPMVEYLIRIYLERKITPIVLSRGYGRKTKGFYEVKPEANAIDVGDEPLQMKRKFNEVSIFVCENRVKGIDKILDEYKPQGKFIIICDDAFQHRRLNAGYYILLWSFDDVQSNRWLLPAGNFRETSASRTRSDLQVITKVPEHTPNTILKEIADELEFDETPLFFSAINYGSFYDFESNPIYLEEANVLLVTGIANPKPLVKYLQTISISAAHYPFADHHNFTQKDLEKLVTKFKERRFDYVLFTEKDYVRIKDIWPKEIPAIYLSIKCEILKDQVGFERRVLAFLERYFD